MISEAEKKNLKIGYKQTMKALCNKCIKVFVAEDCEDKIKNTVCDAALKSGTQVIYVTSMQELGKLCDISLGASCAVIVNA